MRKPNYAKMFTLRKDGYYQKFVNGKYLYDKDPEKLFEKWQAVLSGPPEKTFKEIAEEWEKHIREEISVRTWNNYKPHVEQIVSIHGDKKISQITSEDVFLDLEAAKAEGYSATIVKTRKTIYNQILNYALISDKSIHYNPAVGVKLPKNLPKGKRSAPDEDAVSVILNSLDKPFGFFAYFLLCTGLRKAEALALTKSDIDWKNNQISVTKALEYSNKTDPKLKPPKTENGIRNVPILDILVKPLKEYLSTVDEILFPQDKSNRNPGGGYMTAKAYETAWAKYQQATGLTLTAHQLRHGTATLMFESGVDVYTAQHILGHANISTTLGIYTELRDKQKAKSIKKFNSGMNKYISKAKK